MYLCFVFVYMGRDWGRDWGRDGGRNEGKRIKPNALIIGCKKKLRGACGFYNLYARVDL